MKIGYIFANWKIPILQPLAGSIHIQEICRALGELGHEVFVAAPTKGDEEAHRPELPMVHEIKLPPSLIQYYSWFARFFSHLRGRHVNVAVSARGAEEKISLMPKTVWGDVSRLTGGWLWNQYFHQQARQIIQREQPDGLYERYDRMSTTGVRLAKEFGLPLLLEMNASLTFTTEWGNRHSPLYPLVIKQAEREICQRAHKVLVVSPFLEQYVLSLGIPAEKIVVMLNAVDSERFTPDTGHAADIRRRYGLEQKIVVGFIGSLKHWYGIDLLLDTAKLILEHCRSVHFLIVGDGPLKPRLEKRVRDEGLDGHVTFTGYVPRHEAPSYINAMDIALAPYPRLPNFHFSPLKIFEYMAAAKPVIASRYPNTETVISDHYNGILVEPGDKSLLTQAILELLEDKELRERLGRQARQTVQEKYTWKGNAQRILKLYEEVQAVRINGRY